LESILIGLESSVWDRRNSPQRMSDEVISALTKVWNVTILWLVAKLICHFLEMIFQEIIFPH
jgi:hypothetical protein